MNYKQTLYIFYSLIIGIFIIGVESFIPRGRAGHSSILTGTKLYFFGGATSSTSSSNEVFYLDVSQTFNIASPPLTELTGIPFGSSWAGMSLIDINDDPTIYLFGGIMRDPVSGNITSIPIIHSFNIKTSEWKIPNIKGVIPRRRRDARAVSDNKGKLYIFGGAADSAVGSPTTQFFNDMVILDTTSLIWSYGSSLNAPTKRDGCSATLLTNGVIVYIGGGESGKMIDINQINLYDTNLDSWSVMIATSTNIIIESRRSHSAVLAPDGNIIICGGEKFGSANIVYDSVEPDVAILKTQNTPFEWIVPTVSSNIGKIPSSSASTANLVGNYMIVAFGSFVPSGDDYDLSSKIYIMDIRNYTWIDTFDETLRKNPNNPNNSSSTLAPTQAPPNSEDNKTKIVTGVLGGALGIIFLSAIGFLGYKLHKKYKRKRKEILNIPGSI